MDAQVLVAELDSVSSALAPFRAAHRGALADADGLRLAAGVAEAERILAPLLEATAYAEGRLAADADDEAGARVLARCERVWAEVATQWDFLEPELARARESAEPDRHRNYLARIRDSVALQPPDTVAAALARLDPVPALESLARQLLARITVGGGPLGAALPALYGPDRAHRRERADAVDSALLAEVDVRASVLGALAEARVARAEVSGARDWLHADRVANQIAERDLDALLTAVHDHRDIVHRYYRWKETQLGHPLTDSDRYAPLPGLTGEFSWEFACAVATETFARLGLDELAAELLSGDTVDAFPRAGKQRGAVTVGLPSGRVAVLLNFTGTPRDVLTLAHELGHAAHARLAAGRGAFNATCPAVLGETVALFTESLAATVLAEHVDDARTAVTARAVEDRLVAVFRQVALHDFETWLHAQEEPAGAEALAAEWMRGQRDLYGDAVRLTEGYRHWWSYLDEFFLRPGGRFAYPYGQVAAMALLARFADAPESFGPRFYALLSAGACAPPAELLGAFGVRPDDPRSWQAGLDVLSGQVDALCGTETTG
ncbi:M3 family metallopeptidase [Actinokineospora fastidiosa]|uniref:M3 family metallopeptidase n=1 Tax=Actinokineospora fastidiosa TaxID=1816 RepID=UPI00166FB0CA|nr:M3 family metallopeptidase [Actinokineospora fastidiosa]